MKIKRITKTNKHINMCDIEVDEAQSYSYNGVFVHNSNKQKAKAFMSVGIDTGKKSEKSGQMALDKDTLLALAEKYKKEIKEYKSNPDFYDQQYFDQQKNKKGIRRVPYEIIDWLVERSTLRKQLSSYTEKLSLVDFGFINYNLFLTATGRLSSGGGSGNEYFLNLNYQNLTKPKPQLYRAIPHTHPIYNSELLKDCTEVLNYKFIEVKKEEYVPTIDPTTGSPKLDENGNIVTELGLMLDNEGNPVEDTMYVVEGFKKDLNVRSAITVPDKKDWYFCSMDFSQQEAKLMSNYCLSYEGTVKTSKYGEISLRDVKSLINSGNEILVQTPIGFRRVTNFFDNGKKKKVKIKLESGVEIICSSNHQFLVKDTVDNKYKFLTVDKINKNIHFLIDSTDNIEEVLLKELILSEFDK